ncbi:MAG TPA: efflux RND transporter permease subunit [Caulobacteraceae bacterium]|nr:efflux RND transporter permease subunit [Caulobacteraceae bacterium]
MNLSAPFVRRPIGTVLMTIGLAMAGAAAYFQLPVSPLPQVDLPTVTVRATLPGGSPETMATSVAGPLERHLGRIADVSEMTSRSSQNSAQITLQFGLERDINGAARDVMAAINAARVDLPATLHSNPTYQKVNPADAPIVILAMTSPTKTPGQIYDAASNIVQQQMSQVTGVGEVDIGGASLPAVRADLNPTALAHYGVNLEDVRAALAAANANRPKGVVESAGLRYQVYTNDAGIVAADYAGLIVAYRNNAPVRLSDVAHVYDGVEDIHNMGLYNGKDAVVVIVTRSPGANIIQTVEQIKKRLPLLRAALPADIDVNLALDRSVTIRASLADVERTLAISVVLVVLVVAFFLQSGGATLIPSVCVTVSLLGTLGVMFLLGFSLDNLSLMALTVATGFVVDDAIVVVENTTRHVEAGMPRLQAALKGAAEVGFTVLSMTASLIAVFIPILLMSGIVGRLFREFAITLSAAVIISLVLSLTTTPMMCAYLIGRPKPKHQRGWFARVSDKSIAWMTGVYEKSLSWALDSGPVVLAIILASVVMNWYVFTIVPKGFFPEQDTGQLMGGLQADQSASFQLSQKRIRQFVNLIGADPAVNSVVAYAGGQSSGGFLQVQLKPKTQRVGIDAVVARLRPKIARITGAALFLNPVQDVRAGGRQSNASYQYTLEADDLASLKTWATKLAAQLELAPSLTDVNTDQQDHGLQSFVHINRDTAAQLGLTPTDVDNTLYDAYGQRQVSTIYKDLNQYYVVMQLAPQFSQDPTALKDLYIPVHANTLLAANGSSGSGAGATTASTTSSTSGALSSALTATAGLSTTSTSAGGSTTSGALGPTIGAQSAAATSNAGATANEATAPPGRGASTGAAVATAKETAVPLSAIATWADGSAPTTVNHQDGSAATTISFNLADGKSLSDATADIRAAQRAIGLPTTIHGSFQGTAKLFQDTLSNELVMILFAIVTVYIVLGVLYESYIHPLTVLSTLPSAGVGAVLALIIFHVEFSIIALIGIILLIGIVKKNAIMMIDFALEAQRSEGICARDAIYRAALIRFRPIMMTTFAAILGAIPLAIGWGEGAEMRRPLGLTIIGGLLVSQVLTLLTTPVVYMYLDRFRRRRADEKALSRFDVQPSPAPIH